MNRLITAVKLSFKKELFKPHSDDFSAAEAAIE
jgi:hypothetical protein